MLDAGRPAFPRANSIDCGTHLTAKQKTSFPFIWMHEYGDRLGGKPKTEPFESNGLFDSFSLMAAFKCLHAVRVSTCLITKLTALFSNTIQEAQTFGHCHHYANQKQINHLPQCCRPAT